MSEEALNSSSNEEVSNLPRRRRLIKKLTSVPQQVYEIEEEGFDDLTEPRANSVDKIRTTRQRNEKDDESGPGNNKKKKKKQHSVRDDLEIASELKEMWDSITSNNENPKVVDGATRKEYDDEIAKLFNVRQKKGKWEKDRAEIAKQVEQVMANLEIAVEDDVELNKQGKPAIHKLTKLPILVGALSKKQLQAEFLDHGVLNLLKNWLEPLPDGSLPNINIRTSVLQILDDLCVVLDKQQASSREQVFRIEQLIKSGLPKVVLFLSKSDEETRLNRRLANDLVNRWGHMIYEKSTRYEDMLSQEEREEQQQMLLRRQNKTARETKARGFDEDLDFSAKPQPGTGEVGRARVPTATSMEFVLRPGPKVDKKLEARAKMQVDNDRHERMFKKHKKRMALKKTSLQALKISVDGRAMPKYL